MRKFLLSIFTAIMAIGFVGCEYDDGELWGEVNSLKDRVLTLEQLCQQMNTNITAMQAIVNALQTQDAITAVTPISEGGKVIGYTITFVKGDPITIYHGQNGKDGQNGQNGADGKDGYTPVIGVDKADDGKYYWTLDGEWLTDKEGNKIPATGKDGKDGKDGADGKDGQDGKDGEDGKDGADGKDGQDGKDGDDAAAVMPELRIQGGYWYVSYDGGENWERLGRATGYDGTDGKDGVDGDAFFDNVVVNEQKGYVTFYFTDGTKPIEIPLYKPVFANLTAATVDYVKIASNENIVLNYTVDGCDNPSVVVISNLSTKVDKSAKKITVKAPAARGDLEATETVTLMVSNGSTTIMASVEITVADVVIADANTGGQAELDNALQNSSVSTIVLGEGKYVADIYNGTVGRKSLTIVGTEGTQFAHTATTGGQLRLELFESFTIRNCEILQREGYKTWGMLVFGSSKKANGVYTVDNCTFNGFGDKSIYINETVSGATYNITNCTFNGDFGTSDGIITIQNNDGVNHIVNVTGCKFNVPANNRKISIQYNYNGWTLNTDLDDSDIHWGVAVP